MDEARGLSIDVLGSLVARQDGQLLDLGGRRQRAVLAMLVLARGGTVPVESLVDAVWGDHAPDGAVGTLRSYVSHLRRRLEPDRGARSRAAVIASNSAGYALVPTGDAVDAWRFERLVRDATAGADPAINEGRIREALDLWRGPAYADYADEPWAEAESARLTELREVARDQLAAARLAQGQAAVVVPELEAMVAAQPLREERWQLLVLALYRSHRQGDALAALRRARQVLADELGVDPGPALLALEAKVLGQADSLGASSSLPLLEVAGRRDGGDLVDRDHEVAELATAVTESMAGEARMLLVEGPAGIGKTRLLLEARRLAEQHGLQVFTARGSQLEKEYGFGAVRQLFDTDTVAPSSQDTGAAVMHGLYRLTVALASVGPMLVAIDDLQWCDSASLRFLSYLVHRVEGLPVLIVATLRTGERYDDDLLLSELANDPITWRITPGPLSDSGVADLVRSRFGDGAGDGFVAACYHTTSGNPLLLRQLLRAIQTERVPAEALDADTVRSIGSRAVSSLVLMRLARLSPASTAVAKAIAVLGNDAALPTVAVLAEVTEDEAAVAVGALAQAEVLRDEYPLGFVHPLVAEAVYRDIPPGRRQLQHDRAARVLAGQGAAPEQVAAHLLQVPPRSDPWVVGILRRAAALARERAAPDAAIALLTRAVQEPPDAATRPGLLLELGQAESIFKAPAATAHLREAYDALEDPVAAADLALTLARTLVFVGARGSAAQFAREAAERLPAGRSDDRQALVATERISGYLHDLDAAAWRREPEPMVSGTGRGARMLAVALSWEAVIDGVDRKTAVDLVRFGIADQTLLEADTGLLWVIAGQILDLCDEDSTGVWSAGLAQAHERGDMFTALGMQLWRGWVLAGRGDLREAHQVLAAGNEMSRAWDGGGTASGYGEAFLLGVLVDRGDLTVARDHLEQIRSHARIAEGARLFGEAQARLLMAEGDFAAALASLDGVRDLMATVRNPAWRPWRSLRAAALAGLGRGSEARDLIEEELELAHSWGTPRLVGRTLRRRGQLRGEAGAPDLQEAVELLAGGTAQVELVRAQVALARLSAPGETASLLRQAMETAAAAGADGLYRTARARLQKLGVPVPAQPPPVATLSATERRILDLHLGGVDEREIAEDLFLTPRSVSAALGSIRSRLGARTRDELRSALLQRA